MDDESLIGARLGLLYFLGVITLWIPIDSWLIRHHHETISRETWELLIRGGWKAFMFVFIIFGLLGIGVYHFLFQGLVHLINNGGLNSVRNR